MVIPSPLLVCAAVLELLFLFLRSVPNHSAGVVHAIQLQILSHLLYLVCVFLILRRTAIRLCWVLGIALLFRLTLWTAYPALSDDVYRYRWEGKVQALGGNPYEVRPADERWAFVRDATYPNVGSKDFKAGYGPLVELQQRLVYQIASRFSADPFVQAFWYKLPAAIYESITVGLLLLLIRKRGLPDSRLLLYAWCPTPIVEYWWNGHNDSLTLLLIVGALLLASARRWTPAFVALSVAVAAKLWPILLFPAFVLSGDRERPRWWHWTSLIPIFAVCAIPFWTDVRENAQFMSGFVGGWRNNDSLFGGILWLAHGNLYQAKYMAATLIGILSVAAALLPWQLESACMATLVGTLLLSANVHPWYLSWLVPFLPFAAWGPVFVWIALQPLGYLVLLRWKSSGEWYGNSSARWLVYLPTFLYAVLGWYLEWRRSQKAV